MARRVIAERRYRREQRRDDIEQRAVIADRRRVQRRLIVKEAGVISDDLMGVPEMVILIPSRAVLRECRESDDEEKQQQPERERIVPIDPPCLHSRSGKLFRLRAAIHPDHLR